MRLTSWDDLLSGVCCAGPFVLPAVAGALTGWIIRRRRAANAREIDGRCGRCGYDMRATPERCPECGWVPQLFRDL